MTALTSACQKDGVPLTEEEQLHVMLAINDAINKAIHDFNNGDWMKDQKLMEVWKQQNAESINRSGNPAFKGWQRAWSMPIDTYYKLRDQKFDGQEDFGSNPDAMAWLTQQPELSYLKDFRNASDKKLIEERNVSLKPAGTGDRP
jgi:hypothetical protein